MLNIFPIDIINRGHSVPFSKYSQDLFSSHEVPKLTRSELLKLYREYFKETHGVRLKHFDGNIFPVLYPAMNFLRGLRRKVLIQHCCLLLRDSLRRILIIRIKVSDMFIV